MLKLKKELWNSLKQLPLLLPKFPRARRSSEVSPGKEVRIPYHCSMQKSVFSGINKLLYQASLALDSEARTKVVRKMFTLRFGEEPPSRRSVDQLRGIEGTRVREMYKLLARQYRVPWKGRKYDPREWGSGDLPNRCVSAATACLHGLCEAAILAAGYAPAIGFLHTGKPRSFVYDIADIYKFDTVVPVAFRVAGQEPAEPEREVRLACRDRFRESKILKRIIPEIEDVLSAGGLAVPQAPEDAVGPAFEDEEGLGDDGHRS